MSHILHRGATPPMATVSYGEGVYLFDTDGNRYIDACCGAAVSCLGHSHKAVNKAIKSQIDKVAYAHTGFFTSEVSEALADYLISIAPDNLQQVYFVTGGSEANEAAVKLARQYFVEIGEPQRKHFIARRQSYHGNTVMVLAIGGNEMRKSVFKPILPENTHHIAPCYPYRDQQASESESQYSLRVAKELEDKILELGPDQVVGFFVEPVAGATLGAVPPTPGYLKAIRDICDRYNILLIADEIMCGIGRTGSHFALQQEEVRPDIVTIAKGLGGGYQPIGAALISKDICEAISNGTGYFRHGHTYISHPTTTAAALAVQTEIQNKNLLENVRIQGDYLMTALKSAFEGHPHVGDIRGRGLFIGLEFVLDRATKQPFPPEFALHQHLKSVAMNLGLLVYPMPGTIDGQYGHHVLLAPPFIINNSQCDEIVNKLVLAVNQAIDLYK